MSIAKNLSGLRASLPEGVTLVAVSKTHPPEAIMEAYGAGQRIFGENRPQEMAAKQPLLPADIRWHQIGHLQTNKVKLIAPFVEVIHSVDSARLAIEIEFRIDTRPLPAQRIRKDEAGLRHGHFGFGRLRRGTPFFGVLRSILVSFGMYYGGVI